MTELQLYKFITLNEIEWHEEKRYENGTPSDDIIAFIPYYLLGYFNEALGNHISDDRGIDCVFKSGYICFWMAQICEYFDIEPNNVFKK